MMRCVALFTSFVLVALASRSAPVLGATKEQAYQLYDDVIANSGYNKNVRPIADENNSLFIYMTFKLVSLVGVDEKDQSMISNARLELEWEDYLLSWNESAYGDIDSILVKQKDIWLPDVIIGNSVARHTKMGYDDLPVRVYANGFIVWSPSILATTACDIKVTYYPFDSQICNIEYETTVSLSTEVDINIDQQNPVLTNDFSKDGQWILEDYHAINLSNEDSKTKIRFQLLLKRRTTFYIVNIVMPVLFLSLTASLVFAIPAEAGEKMGTGITVLLAYAVYLTIVTEYLPSTSLQTSILSLYLTILLGYTACAVVLSVLVLRVYHKPESDLVGSKTAALTWVLQKITFYGTSQAYNFHRNSVSPTDDKTPEDAGGSNRYNTMNTPPLYQEPLTWQLVSKTLDWFFFLLFTSMVLLTTLICMLVLVVGGASDIASLTRTQ